MKRTKLERFLVIFIFVFCFPGIISAVPEYLLENPADILSHFKATPGIRKSKSYNAQKQVTSYWNYKYDKKGVLIERDGVSRNPHHFIYNYDKRGLLTSISHESLEMMFMSYFEYDSEGRLVKTVFGLDESGPERTKEYAYDKAGRIIEIWEYENNRAENKVEKLWGQKFYYNYDKTLKKCVGYNGDGKATFFSLFSYDKKRRPVEIHSKSDTSDDFTTLKYNEDGKLAEETLLTAEKKIIRRSEYKYDLKKQLIEITTYSDDGKLMFTEKNEY